MKNGKTTKESNILLGVRPENISLSNKKDGNSDIQGVIHKIKFTGASVEYELSVCDTKVQVRNLDAMQKLPHSIGDTVWLGIKPSDIFLLQ